MSESDPQIVPDSEWKPKVDPKDLKYEMDSGHSKIREFVVNTEFQSVIEEMYALAPEARPDFVKQTVLNEDELKKRGVSVPKDLYLMRSSFGDRRPTLFVIKYYLPKKFHEYWDNVNLTFDQPESEVKVNIKTGPQAWQLPLAPELERLVLSGRVSREVIEQSLNDPSLEAIIGVEDARTS